MPIADILLPTVQRPSRLFTLFAILIYLGCGTAAPANANQADESGMAKLAETAALARHSGECPAVPTQWSTALVTLLIMHTPTEQQIQKQERQALALRKRIGQAKWCTLYATEMEEAFLIYRMTIER